MTNNTTEENVPKSFSNSKAVIEYLAETFPACFSVKGDVKPLKIGIFDDLAKRLENDEQVSKTKLRTALRQYTNSWRYLRVVTVGAVRVDLDGAEAGIVEEEHANHAQETLQASQAKVKQARAESAKAKAPQKKGSPRVSAKVAARAKPKAKPAVKPKEEAVVTMKEAIEPAALRVGQKVAVKLGKNPVLATVATIDKTEAQVQLDSGMTLKVAISELHAV